MKEKMLFKKICSIYANDLHFTTVIFPFIHKELAENTTICTILEKDEKANIEKILENVGLSVMEKEEIRKIDWNNTTIQKIRINFDLIKQHIQNQKKIDILVSGSNLFIEKVNKAIDLWVKNNIELLEEKEAKLSVINCFSFEENKQIDNVIDSHEYILKTAGIQEIIKDEEFLQAN